MVLMAEESTEKQRKKVQKLPFYNENLVGHREQPASEPSGVVEDYVRDARQSVQSVWTKYQNVRSNVTGKYATAKSHTMGVVEFLQNEPELWQRGALIGIAALTGYISGYRRSALVRLRNTLLFSGVATTICWPKETVNLTSRGLNQARRPFAAMWAEYSPWASYQDNVVPKPSQLPYRKEIEPVPDVFPPKPSQAEEDPGQSIAEDKDMYSTRG